MSDSASEDFIHVEPQSVFYCKVCTLPPEYCFYGNKFLQCLEWLKTNNSDLYNKLYADTEVLESLKKLHLKNTDAAEAGEDGENSGKKNEPASAPKVKKVIISKEQRNKKKSTTIISGLKNFEIDLKKAAKLFANKFSCGSSVSANNDVVIQGDVVDNVSNIIISQWPNKITPELIEIK